MTRTMWQMGVPPGVIFLRGSKYYLSSITGRNVQPESNHEETLEKIQLKDILKKN